MDNELNSITRGLANILSVDDMPNGLVTVFLTRELGCKKSKFILKGAVKVDN